MVTHRFGLCISGAVSLGAYEAGVIAQLYRDFHTVNQAMDGRARLVIDAIAGASAGSVTGLILAQALALQHSPDQLEARMRACWVDQLDILELLDPAADPAQALFTDGAISRAEEAVVLYPPPDEFVRDSDVLALWITLTNLDGIPYELRFRRSGEEEDISYYPLSYRDYSPFFICGPNIRFVNIPIENIATTTWGSCRQASWSEARDSAVASAAFPVAFRTRTIERDLTLYPQYAEKYLGDPRIQRLLRVDPRAAAPRQRQSFSYADGGVFNNEPIGRAIDAASYLACLDRARLGDRRTYVVIEPDPASRETASGHGDTRVAADNGLSPATVVGKIEKAYITDALYRDFEEAAKTNERLQALATIAKEWNLSTQQLDQLKQAVGLAHKDVISLERIPLDIPMPGADRLAGAFAGHFGGFLLQGFREHDFAVGCVEARQWLARWLPAQFSALGLPPADQTRIVASLTQFENPPPSGASWDEVPAQRQLTIVARGLDRAEVLAHRWLALPASVLALLRALFGPAVQAHLARAAQVGPTWTGVASALWSTPLGRVLVAVVAVASAGFVVLSNAAAQVVGAVVAILGLPASAVAGAVLGSLLFVTLIFGCVWKASVVRK
jgi:predicted acylesterase/phospholipase RssA